MQYFYIWERLKAIQFQTIGFGKTFIEQIFNDVKFGSNVA